MAKGDGARLGIMASGIMIFIAGIVFFVVGNWFENWAEGTKITLVVVAAIGGLMFGAGRAKGVYSTRQQGAIALQQGGVIENFLLNTVSSTAVSEYAI